MLLLLLLWLLASTYSGYISLNRVAISPIIFITAKATA
jgi:hypothetical protein